MEVTIENLTKETEVKGKTFIPLYKIAELELLRRKVDKSLVKLYIEVGRVSKSTTSIVFESKLNTNSSVKIDLLGINLNPILCNPYWVIIKLKEWGFQIDLDVDNLFTREVEDSEKCEINKNTSCI